MVDSTTSRTSSADGQMSESMTGWPSDPVPIGSVVRSMSTRPARAKATTSGGEARNAAFTCGLTRPSKLRLPDSTAATTISLSSMALVTGASSGPELPMHVVHP